MLEVRGLEKSFGSLAVTAGVSLRLQPGERRVVLGPNGAGKTTLFNLLVGELRPDAGAILLGGEDITAAPVEARARRGLSRSYQKNNLFDDLSVAENLALAVSVADGLSGSILGDSLAAPAVRGRVAEVAAMTGLGEMLGEAVSAVAYGVRRQLEVALALATRPKVLLLDEPTSGIGPGMTRAFNALLKSLPRDLTILVIEHDMDLAFDIADRITVLNYGKVVFEGSPAETRASPLVNEIYLGGWQDGHA